VRNSGAVYVFTRSGGTWAQQAYVKASNPGADDMFGQDVGLSADGSTLAVGARESSNGTGVNSNAQADNSMTYSGAVYVFTRSGNAWSQQAYIKASNTGAGDMFGYALALADDGNTLAVGAPHEKGSGTGVYSSAEADDSMDQAGAAYLFTRSGSTWTQRAYVKPTNTGAGDQFGHHVALSGDGSTLAVAGLDDSNGTGINSSAQADESLSNSGAVYLFARSGAVWMQQAYVKASNPGANDGFGGAIALSKDGSTLAIGAREDSDGRGVNADAQADDSATNSGAAYVFTRSGNAWAQVAYVKASNSAVDDWFGDALAISADGTMIAIGAPGEDSSGTGVNGATQGDDSASGGGAVYVFR
jgi:hypothetical protein